MDAESLLMALVRLQLVASAAILVVLLLRRLALRWYGAGIAYWLWLIVPLAVLAASLPAREQFVVLPAASDIPVLQERVELAATADANPAASPPALQPGVPFYRLSPGLLLALWLLGAGVFLIRSIVNTRRLASSASIGPALVGVFRPRLVLPQDFEARFNAEERALILAHEEMHRISRHTLVNALVEVARCASWVNPLVHWAAVRFRADQELACDTAVIAAHPGARRTYAEALLKAQVAGAYLPLGCVWTSRTAGRLAERIERLSEQLPGRQRRFLGAVFIVGVGFFAGFAAWTQQPAQNITVQQSSLGSAEVVPNEIPANEVRGAVRPAVSQAPIVNGSAITPLGAREEVSPPIPLSPNVSTPFAAPAPVWTSYPQPPQGAVSTAENGNVVVDAYIAFVDDDFLKELYAGAPQTGDSSRSVLANVVTDRAAIELLKAAHLAQRAEILWSPKLVVLDRSQATVEQARDLGPASDGTLESTSRMVSFRLQVTPVVTPNESIQLSVDLKSSASGRGVTVADGIEAPSITTSRMATQNVLTSRDAFLATGFGRSDKMFGTGASRQLVVLLTATALRTESDQAR